MELRHGEFGVEVIGEDALPVPIRQVLGIGLNYAAHAREQGHEAPVRPMVFSKNPACCCLDGDSIRLPRACADREQVDFEGELAVIIGQAVRDVPLADALDVVLGYAVGNDVSARWWQKEGSGRQFYRGKSFDTFCPLGPRVVPAVDVPDPQTLRIQTWVNGEAMQDSRTSDMIFSVRELIAELSRDHTLLPGTVILTGTPSGVGFARNPQRFLRDGDAVEIEIEGVGRIRNPVVNA